MKEEDQENSEQKYEQQAREELEYDSLGIEEREKLSADIGQSRKSLVNRFSMIDTRNKGQVYQYVRIPVSFGSTSQKNGFINCQMYLYLFSLKPQIYWIKKGTYATVSL